MKTTRRNFITKSMLATAGMSVGLNSVIKAANSDNNHDEFALKAGAKDDSAFKISIFSKHLQWLGYSEMARVAADMGFDGVDLTVRTNGHVLPERVEEDLPKAMEAVKKAGMNVYMITTSVSDADDPLSDKVLKTASSLGIRHYRMGYDHYDETKSIEENLNGIELKLRKLAKLNEKYSISGEYQNHSGVSGSGIYFGSPIWDLYQVLHSINSKWLGSQYDIFHATIEGANAWPIGLKQLSPYVRSIDIKDFHWIKNTDRWRSQTVPLGEGMVDYKKYLRLLKEYKISCPVSLHYEYPIGGAEHGARKLTMKKEDVISTMEKDLNTFKKYLQEANLV
jgi:sugar phosphate isomerase/epimerase